MLKLSLIAFDCTTINNLYIEKMYKISQEINHSQKSLVRGRPNFNSTKASSLFSPTPFASS